MSQKVTKLGRPSLYRPEYCEQLISHMEKGHSFESFAATINVCDETLYEWCKQHPDFSDAKKEGRVKSLLLWEKIGMQGVIKNNISAALWIFTMKSRFAQYGYHEKMQIEQNTNITDNTSKRPVTMATMLKLVKKDPFILLEDRLEKAIEDLDAKESGISLDGKSTLEKDDSSD